MSIVRTLGEWLIAWRHPIRAIREMAESMWAAAGELWDYLRENPWWLAAIAWFMTLMIILTS